MAKKEKQPEKTCADCIHEIACRGWTDGRVISDVSASQCPNHETVKESGAYLCGVLDERKRKKTNADRIRAMSDEELAVLINKGIWSCEDCQEYVCDKRCDEHCLEWLKQPAEP